MAKIRILKTDITRLKVDAIVNAANELMLGGGGVDGAIHEAAGSELLKACRRVPLMRKGVRCPTGEARITVGGDLPAKYVIHTVGPIWHGGSRGEPKLLEACYYNSLRLVDQEGMKTVAFPAVSCGVFRFPPIQAARIAVNTVRIYLATHHRIEKIILTAFNGELERILNAALLAGNCDTE